MRIALLGIYHESNTYVPDPTRLSDFHNGHYITGDAIRDEYQHAHHEIGGMLEVMDQKGYEVVPLVFAEATPGGTVSADTYEQLLNHMMQELEQAMPVDGCLVVPHGAGVSENIPDLDGHWLGLLREKLGPSVPIIGTLDLHANVSPAMVSATDALVSYRQNPHVDQRQRGKEAARLLADCLEGKITPRQILVQVPLAISIEQQFTDSEPCKSLYEYAEVLRQQQGILSLSIQLGFPYADVEELGTSIIVVSDKDREQALTTGKKLMTYIMENRESFVGEKTDIPTALSLIPGSNKPVLLLDMGDNIGGGSPGNNICILEALELQVNLKYFVCIYDPQAVDEAKAYKVGDTFPLTLNGTGKYGPQSLEVTASLVQMSEGNFKEDNPRHGGQVNFKMGKTAIVSTRAGSIIMLTSLRVMPFSLGQLTSVGIDPMQFDAIVAKGVNAPIAAYAPVCPTMIQVNTPGVTQADMTLFDFKHRRKPLFPFEKEGLV